MFRFTLYNTLRVSFLLILITVGTVFLITYRHTARIREAEHNVSALQNQIMSTEKMLSLYLDHETAVRGLLLSKDTAYFRDVARTGKIMEDEAAQIHDQFSNQQNDQMIHSRLLPVIAQTLEFSRQVQNEIRSGKEPLASPVNLINAGIKLEDQIRSVLSDIRTEEYSAMDRLKTDNERSVRQLNGVLYGVLFFAMIFGLLAIYKTYADYGKQQEHKLQLENYRELVEHAHVMAWNMKPEVVFWNLGMERLYGWTREEVMGKDPHQLLRCIYPVPYAEIEKILQKKNEWSGELRHTRKDGSVIYVSSHLYLHQPDTRKPAVVMQSSNNITDQKQAESALALLNENLERKVNERTMKLQESELKFRVLVENAQEGIIQFDEQRRVTYMSPAVEKLTGWTFSSIRSFSDFEYVEPLDRVEFRQVYEESLDQPGLPIQLMVRIQHKEGHLIWIEGTLTNYLHVTGIRALVLMCRDITERKNAEQRVTESEKKYRALIEYNYDGIILSDEASQILYESPSAQKISGWPKDERATQPPLGLIHPDDLPQVGIINRFVLNNPGKPYFGSCRRLQKDGTYQWIEYTCTNLIADPNVGAIVTNLRDITDRKNAEELLLSTTERLESVLKRMADGFMILNADWEFVFTNNRLFELFPSAPPVLRGRKIWDMLPDLRGSLLEMELLSVMETGENRNFEYHFRTPDKWIFFRVTRIVDGISVFFNDISKQKMAEQALKKLHHELEQKVEDRTAELQKVNKELEAFTYSVSHDLRAPLRGIIGFTSILEEEYGSRLDDEARRLTLVIKNNTTKMGQLIDDLLSFSRIGRAQLQKTEINPQRIVGEIIQDFNLHTREHPVEWVVQDLPVVKADLNSFRQVWVNLISNAVKYSGKSDKPVIEIGALSGIGQITFYVKDNGVGFDEKYTSKLFKVFQRLHTSDEFEGTGVGLAIVDKIIAKHGGKVWARSESGQGACFSFSIPDL